MKKAFGFLLWVLAFVLPFGIVWLLWIMIPYGHQYRYLSIVLSLALILLGSMCLFIWTAFSYNYKDKERHCTVPVTAVVTGVAKGVTVHENGPDYDTYTPYFKYTVPGGETIEQKADTTEMAYHPATWAVG